ncbi:hypothetical protein EV186_1021094 [Labedaea rhizosphaerae]|uniref:Uncharacterized protein n=1 Tax=Labedaea rhizosphaerae TaxID=598644 RepID=A0A4R6SIL2_LABRH|nr:hypothetical protein EV186_1021094 [Labedaea rhizosphaerae]
MRVDVGQADDAVGHDDQLDTPGPPELPLRCGASATPSQLGLVIGRQDLAQVLTVPHTLSSAQRERGDRPAVHRRPRFR